VLTANVSSSDAAGYTVTYGYVWNKNGVAITGQTGSTLNLSVLGNGGVGDSITVTVTPYDGTLYGTAATSAADRWSAISNCSVAPSAHSLAPAARSTLRPRCV